MNITLAICDDENPEIEYLKALTEKWARDRNLSIRLLTFSSAERFLFAYDSDKAVDILLLDIQMSREQGKSQMDGISLARKIRSQNETMQLIFVTGLPEYVGEGYEVSALHYLMKPVKEGKLFETLDKALKNLSKTERHLLLASGGASLRVSAGEILSVESFAHKSEITTKAGKIETKLSISELEAQLGEGFVRCHRSYLVGLKYISRISKTDIILDNGVSIPLSRRLYEQVNQAFIQYYKGGSSCRL